jgi:pyruvyltransferase
MTVEIFEWNPKRPIFRGPVKRLVPVKRRVNNFGDLLGKEIVHRLRKMDNLPNEAGRTARLLSVGSILHFARDGDVVWGSGVNGKIPGSSHTYSSLDVRAVRGPLTRDFLNDRGIEVPEIFGDPALLLPHVAPELVDAAQHKKHKLTIVPNFQDLRLQRPSRPHPNLLNPTSGLWRCLYRIVQSELVVGSSLHAIIVAEAFGVPARAVQSRVEHEFKYLDYYTGTGRKTFSPAPTVRDAIKAGGEPSPLSSVQPLLNAFPSDLWK